MLLSSPPPPPGEPQKKIQRKHKNKSKNGVIQKFQKEFPGLVLLWSLSVFCLGAGCTPAFGLVQVGLGCVSGFVFVDVRVFAGFVGS